MKYAIMSDAHANPQALETALADARAQGCETFVFAGDVTGYGYDVRAALRLVRESFDVVLTGNHDAVCSGRESGWNVLMCANYDVDREQSDALDDEERNWLRGLPYESANGDFAVVHGDFTHPKAWNYVFTTEMAVPNFFVRDERALFCGHTHHAAAWEMTKKGVFRPKCEKRLARPATKAESVTFKLGEGCRCLVNVGSVGYPRNDLCSTYAIYDPDLGRVAIRRLPFDFKSYVSEMLAHGIDLPHWLCDLLRNAAASRTWRE